MFIFSTLYNYIFIHTPQYARAHAVPYLRLEIAFTLNILQAAHTHTYSTLCSVQASQQPPHDDVHKHNIADMRYYISNSSKQLNLLLLD